MKTNSAINNLVNTPTISLSERVQQNWQTRKITFLGSGVSTAALGAGIAVAAVLGGPMIAIATLAAATLASLSYFLKTALTSQTTSTRPATTVPTTIEKALAALPPVLTQKISISTNTAQPAQQEPESPSKLQKMISYAQEHPYQTAALAAGLLTAAAGYYGLFGRSAGALATSLAFGTPATPLALGAPASASAPAVIPPAYKTIPTQNITSPTAPSAEGNKTFSFSQGELFPPSCPANRASQLTVCQKAERVWTSAKNTVSGWFGSTCKTPEYAAQLRKQGIANLNQKNMTMAQLDAELASVQKVDLSYLEKRYGAGLMPNGKARELYGLIDLKLPEEILASPAASNLSTEAKAKLMSDIRLAAKEYIRTRNHPGRVLLLEERDLCEYGTTSNDFLYYRGRKEAEHIMKSAQKTNWLYNFAADYWPCA